MIRFLLALTLAFIGMARAQVQYVFLAKDTAELARLNPLSYRVVAIPDGSIFWYDSATAAGTNSDTVIKSLSGAGTWKRVADGLSEMVSITDFGAGGFPQDDTISISNAVVVAGITGKTVVYPPGTYKQSTILLTNNVRVIGYGATIYQISIPDIPSNYGRSTPDISAPLIFPKASSAFLLFRSTNITVEGLKFTMAPTAEFFGGAQRTIINHYSSDVVIRNCEFAGTNGIASPSISAGKNILVENCEYNQNVFHTGQANKYTDVYWDATYDSAEQHGVENLWVKGCKFSGTNATTYARIAMTGVQSFLFENNILRDIQGRREIIQAYCGDRGLHYYDGGTATNASWRIEGNTIKGTNNYYGGVLASIVNFRGNSGDPNTTPGREDTLKIYTGYGSTFKNNFVEGGSGKYAIQTAVSGVIFEGNSIAGDMLYAIFAGNGVGNDNVFRGNTFNLTSGTILGSNSAVTNKNWLIEKNIFSSPTASMANHALHVWDDLTLHGNEWRCLSTGEAGSVDALWRLTYTNHFIVDGEKFVLYGTTYNDADIFDLTPTAGSDIVFRNSSVSSMDSSAPIYAGVFQMPRGLFQNNDIGAARFEFSERGMLLNNKFRSKVTSREIIRIHDSPDTDVVGNLIEQQATSAFSAIRRTGTSGNMHLKWNSIQANSSAAAVDGTTGYTDMEDPVVSNAGAGGLYAGSVFVVKHNPYELVISRPGAAGSVGIHIDNEWSGTRDVKIIPIPDSGTGGVAAYFWNGNFLRFGFGFNPLNRRFEIGTNSTTRPFYVTENGLLTSFAGVIANSVQVDDLVYGAPWLNSTNAPTRNAVYNEMEAVKSSATTVSGNLTTLTTRTPTTIFLTGDESVTASTTLADSATLKIALLASKIYVIKGTLFIFTAGAASGYKIGINGPASPTKLYVSTIAQNNSSSPIITASSAYGLQQTRSVTSSGSYAVEFTVSVSNGVNAGDLTVQFAQAVSDAAAVSLKAASLITVTRVN